MEKVKRTPASLKKMVETFGMEILHRGSDFDSAVITISDVNRPALQLVGFYDYFDDKRLQILGRGEMRYLDRMTEAERLRVFNKLMSYPFPALIVARNMDVPGELLQMAEKHDRTLLRAADSTVDVTSRLIDYLNRVTAPQITRHGVLMNIYGQGVLILGDSGIGKSETAIELLKRGHRLVADDAVEIRRVSNSLYGTAPRSSGITSRSAAWASSTCSSCSAWALCSSTRRSIWSSSWSSGRTESSMTDWVWARKNTPYWM